jgi:UDP-N-acetylmuramoyl-tripeptide--D-alanyl-D-alanine ligase
LHQLKPYHLRSEIFQIRGITIINDCYNANPVSMKSAIETLMSYPGGGRKIAVLADMLELGRDEIAFHIEIGGLLDKAGVDALFAFGKLAKYYLDNYRAGYKEYFNDKRELSSALQKYVKPDDVVLIKGSRAMALEEITDFMMNDR